MGISVQHAQSRVCGFPAVPQAAFTQMQPLHGCAGYMPVDWEKGLWSHFPVLTLGSAVQAAIWGCSQKKAWECQEREIWINESVRWVEGEQPREKMVMKIICVGGGKIEKRYREITSKMGKG